MNGPPENEAGENAETAGGETTERGRAHTGIFPNDRQTEETTEENAQ